ncbi:MAG: PIN domain-containing protein [Burkholderiaceae bacterium]
MNDRAFVDTNVIVHLFDARTPDKRRAAAELLARLAQQADAPVISTQVLQEAFSALTRKLGMDAQEALDTLRLTADGGFTVQPIDVPLVWKAALRSIEDTLSFWDALIVEAARQAGCTVLYSEDMQTGRSFDGLTVRNPFS